MNRHRNTLLKSLQASGRASVERLVVWLRRTELPVLIALMVFASLIWIFVEMAGEVLEGDTKAVDGWVLDFLRNPSDPERPRGPRWLVEAGRDITALGGAPILALMTAAAAGYLYLRGKHHAMWVMLLAVISGAVASTLLKMYFSRERPFPGSDLTRTLSYSFPSGHSMLSAVVYLVLGAMLARMESQWIIKVYFLSLAVILSVLVGVSRVYLGVHYPTDVLAGWSAGVAWAVLWWLVARYLQQRGSVEASSSAA